jgi:hypothetical protein
LPVFLEALLTEADNATGNRHHPEHAIDGNAMRGGGEKGTHKTLLEVRVMEV